MFVVVGDGAVGIAVAVALSGSDGEVILAGPRGTPEKKRVFSTEGHLRLSAEILHTAIDRISAGESVIVALKAYSIRDAVPDIKEISNGKVICLSNGMGLDEEWGDLAGRVEYSVLSMGFRKTDPITVLTTDGVVYCEPGSAAAGIFASSRMSVEEVGDISELRWAKWYANSIINPIGALTGLENNRIVEAGLRPLIDKLSREIAVLMPSRRALAEGRRILEWLLEHSSNRCSMLQDIEKGLPTEIDFLTGLRETGSRIECPVTSQLVSEIKRYAGRSLRKDELLLFL
ncbi:MAG: ketopantoate reductase family protein [Candidatus Sabulitectum sp.]|nr:ketopantoate reductase family protein [Candidatus Sabulitectum sp.]